MAFADAPAEQQVNVYAMFDNEEVGSSTKQGAASTFLRDTLTRIAGALGIDDAQLRALITRSMMVSADNALDALHPNHQEKFDGENRVYMNEGVVIKYNANQRYTTDGVSGGAVRPGMPAGGGTGTALCEPVGCCWWFHPGAYRQYAGVHEHRGYWPGAAGHAFCL